jgi:hypothetical protein
MIKHEYTIIVRKMVYNMAFGLWLPANLKTNFGTDQLDIVKYPENSIGKREIKLIAEMFGGETD